MNLVSIRIITADIDALLRFYERITGVEAIRYTPDFAELKTPTATLAIGSTRTLQFFGGENVAKPAENRTAIIEFMVNDVERIFEHLRPFLDSYLIQKPTIMPWGNKSLLFRDPDGNLVNFFSPVTEAAAEKFRHYAIGE
ncbi:MULTISPECIES: VOC family protein [Chryseobacterium]|uniref:Catechol 2,3-dioxygenase-like lactoylglutathione lyase family enzyme n=1 Tax=Chryseobacterium camelliae TaxID=1265445 RepID=A0ABU0THI0_9FLAO|nr:MULTISPECIES: VOC family protein [Chryseobacterium]MDT3405688.1 catechol 2,3-dioxygenase-like lactoylglutathione lyase family enzyme [Pseudacidovorax intermedius]MDQ1096504.1 catechol 2,3-dioxygenase-like lactoylglutathione lyase family enzyme [Chryseobacterium camelliae]MDQ1100445.1 catechol 2,3-dioxygenase-like lactoylglutathione lyase family enzyme [Chryseobacterium sp. SORGH_AS_1048]MDR6087785.1 catechol 2,3-dioxygenase-like lactoylglutathione lyase family enzyme [Chryseobacterium sp. SO